MFFEVNKPLCSDDLGLALDLIERILNYLVSKGNEKFDQEEFEDFFGEGKWLCQKSTVKESLEKLFKLTKEDREEFLDVFTNDIKFSDNECFLFKIHQLNDEKMTTFKSFLLPFYQNILGGSGFSNIPGLKYEPLKREHVRQTYIMANPKYHAICPICLGEIQPFFNNEKDFNADLDHYFPKKIYPTLVIHPDNLFPTCQTCNGSRYKGSKDVGLFGEIFLPYHRPAFKETRIVLSGFGGRRKFRIIPLVMEDEVTLKRINNLERVYKLSERWTAKLEILYDNIIEELAAHEYPEKELSQDDLFNILRRKIEIGQNFKHSPNNILKSVFLEWLSNDGLKALYGEFSRS